MNTMKILVVGSGAREHAIVEALHCSPQKPQIFCYGQTRNPGIQRLTSAYEIGVITDIQAIVHMAEKHAVDLAIIGPEAPLEQGVADILWGNNIAVVGPSKSLARIETSKGFARELMKKYTIAGLPNYQHFNEYSEKISQFLHSLGEGNYVVKANGLMGGKGVKIAGEHLHSFDEAISFCQQVFAQDQSVIIEEKLIGQEFSLMCFADGKTLVPMPLVQDHKRAYVGDKGPNTGGMGSYSDSNHQLPFLTQDDVASAFAINQAIFKALMAECGKPYMGILYGSFIATAKGIYVIEFNARFGDPEVLNVLAVLKSDFLTICRAMVKGELAGTAIEFSPQASVCKYVVPQGYPDDAEKNFIVDLSRMKNTQNLYLAAVHQQDDQLWATGARTAACVGIASTIDAAEKLAEEKVNFIGGPLFHRADIGTAALIAQRIEFMERLRQ